MQRGHADAAIGQRFGDRIHAVTEQDEVSGGERSIGERLEKEFERTLILRALQHTGGRRMEAAQWLGWGRNTLTRKIQELKLDPDKR